MKAKIKGTCACGLKRKDCTARCAVCGADGQWTVETQDYRCAKHPVAAPSAVEDATRLWNTLRAAAGKKGA